MELKLIDLYKKYDDIVALNHINLTFTQGIYGILGANGAGKTTMINLIVGNLAPTSGQILYDGTDVLTDHRSFREKLGYMPQQQALYPTFSAKTFLGYIAALKGMSAKQAQLRIPRVLEMVDLLDSSQKKIGSFSGGMKQRLLIAQAMLSDPDILILDEPTAGLDPKQRIMIRNLIAEIAETKIVLIATHVVQDVEYISKEIVLMRKGVIMKADTRGDLIETLKGHVFEIRGSDCPLDELQSRYQVSGIARDNEDTYIRILSPEPPDFCAYTQVRPTLEDVYLWYNGE